MSEQRGLRNPDTHGTTSDGEPYCESCGVCDEGWRCRCCLAAEVEALREKVKQHEVVFKVQAEALKSTREQVQRVRLAMSAHKVEMYVGALRVYAVPTAKLQIALDTDE